jgi:hypothetical protein
MRSRVLVPTLLALSLSPSAVLAQGGDCDLVSTSTSRTQILNAGTPQQMFFIGGGAILRCPDGLSIRSDSAVHVEISNSTEFIGHVVYRDSARVLTAGHVQYLGAGMGQVVARDNVVLTDTRNGSTLRGPFLNYMMKNETRPEDYISLPTGRPVATLIRPSAQDSTKMDTTVMVSNTMEIFGETRFVGRGDVNITRGTVKAFAATAEFMEGTNRMRLVSNARVETEDYTLNADSILSETTEAGEFREVLAEGQARLKSQDLQADAPRIRVQFTDGVVSRLFAIAPDTAAKPRVQAHAVSPDFSLDADSIDVVAPQQKVESVTAVGTAYGVRTTADSAVAAQPELVRHDWVRGDTIIARFTEAPPPPANLPADSARPDRVLEHLDVRARAPGQASSLYRAPDRSNPAAGYTVNYLLARRIQVSLENGEVERVEAEGQIHGLYLRPTGGPPGTTARPGGATSRP